MNLERVSLRRAVEPELPLNGEGETQDRQRSEEALTTTTGNAHLGKSGLMEEVVATANVQAALKRVERNRGSPGTDGMTVGELRPYLREHWQELREQLLAGTYQPQAVRRQQIPKKSGGMRDLGIPSVIDRFIQQALLQVLQPQFDPSFSNHSYGFRPGRSAKDAILQAQRYIEEGRGWVVDVDLEKFFDCVNHDKLMGRLVKRIADKRVLRLIRRYLRAGMMANGVVMERREGTPQGGPLSPLLANVLLDEIDKELEKRGHAFVRYADDCNVYVRSKRAGERVMGHLRKLYAKLKLRVNESKSAVAPATERSFLGIGFWIAKGRTVKRRVAKKALMVMTDRVREITGRSQGRSIEQVVAELRSYLNGWRAYFEIAQTPRVFETHDKWIRRRLRMLQLKQWRCGATVYRELRRLGASDALAAKVASRTDRWWATAASTIQKVLTNRYLDKLGVPRLAR